MNRRWALWWLLPMLVAGLLTWPDASRSTELCKSDQSPESRTRSCQHGQ